MALEFETENALNICLIVSLIGVDNGLRIPIEALNSAVGKHVDHIAAAYLIL